MTQHMSEASDIFASIELQDSPVCRFPRNGRARLSLESVLFALIILVVITLVRSRWFSSTNLAALSPWFIMVFLLTLYDLLYLIPRRILFTFISITDDSLTVHEGKFFERMKIIPINRITLIEKSNGPLSRLFHQEKFKITSTTEEISLPYLSVDDADRLSSLIITKNSRIRNV